MNDLEHIAEIDKTLAILRESWLEAKLRDKPKRYLRINISPDLHA